MKKLALLASIALVACAVWMFTRTDDPDVNRAGAEDASRSSSAPPEYSLAQSTGQPALSGERELPRASAVPGGPTLVALDAESGAPLANADVLWCAEPAWRRILFALGQSDDPVVDDARANPRWFMTDDEGRVVLPPCDERVHVRVYHGALEGRATFAARDGGEHGIELTVTEDLLVHVVDVHGTPAAEVEVSFRESFIGEVFARTNAAGLARLRDRRAWMREHRDGMYMRVACRLSLGEPVAIVLRRLPGPEPIELRLPTSSVLVVVNGGAGRGGPSFAGVEARILSFSGAARDEPMSARFHAGAARFPWIEPGSTWAVALSGPGVLAVFLPASHALRSEAGETVIDVSAAKRAWVGVRILDVDGTVFASRHIQFDYARSADTQVSARGLPTMASTDADGRVWYTPFDGEYRWLVLWRESRTKSVVVDLSREFPIGETLLPDVKLLAQ
jgi:hypothetical protein